MLERFTWYKQSAFQWSLAGVTAYIDPWGVPEAADPADVIFITHAHFDHFQPDEIERLRKADAVLVAPHDVAEALSGDVRPVRPGDSLEVAGIGVRTVPAYNVHPDRLHHHPKEKGWVGYVLTLGEHVYYHAGDTDHAPELDAVRTDVAFLPIGGTYTMDATAAAGLAKAIAPQLAVPMHYGFVVGSPEDAMRFRQEADPVKVEILAPFHPFEQE